MTHELPTALPYYKTLGFAVHRRFELRAGSPRRVLRNIDDILSELGYLTDEPQLEAGEGVLGGTAEFSGGITAIKDIAGPRRARLVTALILAAAAATLLALAFVVRPAPLDLGAALFGPLGIAGLVVAVAAGLIALSQPAALRQVVTVDVDGESYPIGATAQHGGMDSARTLERNAVMSDVRVIISGAAGAPDAERIVRTSRGRRIPAGLLLDQDALCGRLRPAPTPEPGLFHETDAAGYLSEPAS